MNVYQILLEKRAERDLRRLPQDIFSRIIRAIEALADDPRPAGSRKIVGARHDWRIRVGDYRAIYEIDDRAKEVRVMYVRHRRDAYR